MNIAITGATGLIGQNLSQFLERNGHKVSKLSRSKTNVKDFVHFDYKSKEIELDKLEHVDVIVHLAGESIAGYWTKHKKEEIKTSRVEGTRFLVNSILKLQNKPKHFICASAIGAYGNRDDEIVDEKSDYGNGFLADISKDWENEASVLESHNIRVVNLRIGLVLSNLGGALKSMLLPFKMGMGGKLGSGQQYMSWVMLEDVVGAIDFIINNKDINGPVNIVAPKPVTNEQFTKELGNALGRPTILNVPAFVLNTLVPDMAKEIILSSTRAVPQKLLDKGYQFQYTDIDSAFDYLLN